MLLMLPALRARALLLERDYVVPADIEALAPYVFAHRLTVAPGAGPAESIVAECLKPALERLARASMRR